MIGIAMASSTATVAPPRKAGSGPGWLAAERAEFLIESVGGVRRLAGMLGVSASQPSRWRRGEESPSLAVSRRLLDLDHVLARALLLWEEPVARDWLESPNGHLNGARPIDVLMTRGAGEVTDALDATQGGAFA
jgi:uncharacterized protein (DUF2384 family)